jgi:hypothetical protein
MRLRQLRNQRPPGIITDAPAVSCRRTSPGSSQPILSSARATDVAARVVTAGSDVDVGVGIDPQDNLRAGRTVRRVRT